jgi:hypothetical protein
MTGNKTEEKKTVSANSSYAANLYAQITARADDRSKSHFERLQTYLPVDFSRPFLTANATGHQDSDDLQITSD